MKQPLEILRSTYADPYAAARAHRSSGGKVVGYFLNSVPEELIIAAGCFPVRLRGEFNQQSALAERYMEEYMDGEVRSIFGALLHGRFDFVDLIVIPRNSEVYLQLYYFLLEIPRWESQIRVPPIYLFDLLQTPSSATLRYVTGRLHALAERLTEISGREITSESLSGAIVRINAKRVLLNKTSALWKSDKTSLTGVDALATISCASFMQHDDYVATLTALLDEPPAALGPRVRLMIKGSPQADVRFTALVESLGGAVVAHDHLWGDRTYASKVQERSEPWAALARHYCLGIPSPREYPQTQADEHFLQLATHAKVDGVIFLHDEWDDTLGWEYPDQKRLLEQRGIRSLFLKRQRYFDPDEKQQRGSVRAFIEQLQVRA
jgi:benzoyl-CoA reductase/2-hydroxyglutaryl-CoA dehydratase subunit BcrC/BadD/HgdB